MLRDNRRGYAWAVVAGLNAALGAISAKLFSSQNNNGTQSQQQSFIITGICFRVSDDIDGKEALLVIIKFGLVVLFNVTMWGCYVNSLKALSSLQATVTNFATNFLTSGLAGYILFEEPLPSRWFAGAIFIVIGVFILSKSSIEQKSNSD